MSEVRALIVDDSSVMRKIVERSLRQAGLDPMAVFEAGNGAEGLDQLKAQQVDLILSDINMPGMNGLILLKLLKEHYPDLKVFMVTAYGDDKNYQAAKEYGADNFLTKPIDFVQLKKLMEEANSPS